MSETDSHTLDTVILDTAARLFADLSTSETINAAEAHRLGLVQRLAPRPELYEAAAALAARLAALDPVVVQAAKAAVTRGLDLPLAEGLALEAQYVGLTLSRRKKG